MNCWSRLAATLLVLFTCSTHAFAQDDGEAAELREQLRKLEERIVELEEAKSASKQASGDDVAPIETSTETQPDETPLPDDDDPSLIPPIELPKSLRLEIGGSLRVRSQFLDPVDYRIPGTFGRAATADPKLKTDIHFLRTRLHFDFRVVDGLNAFVEIQDARAFGDTPVTTDSSEFHLRQGYIEVDLDARFDVPLNLKVGRYPTPSLGDGRLLSDPGFNNIGRQWDGAIATFEPEGFHFTGFVGNLREGAVFAADQDENDDFWISGVYASVRLIDDHEFDAYLYWRHLSDRIFESERSTRLGDRKDFTLGGRVLGKAGPIKYTFESAWQWGDQAGDRVRAWAAVGRVWTTFELGGDAKLTLATEYAYASGDRDPDDGKRQTFDAIFGFRFAYYGRQNLTAWQNAHNVMIAAKLEPIKNLSLHCDGFFFWKDKRKDAWYRVDGPITRRDPTGAAHNYIGTEVDVYAIYTLWERLKLQAHVSHFFDGPFIRDTGFSTDRTALFGLAKLTF